ncbi:MAG: bifunctional oligoribonuclease/PAP phosphatase NrnA [Candidatus Omnitrophica bacterium]|jgi:phosphoesterase RecJ-like protein|nr:bifunctional oligoribonuclease/PAP phosphatase NrnA [Candidatus Omnitrophota bacterium]
MKGLTRAKRVIDKAKNIVVAGHLNPDGDSIGSMLSLGIGLENLGKKVHMISPDGVPKKYRELPGADRIVRHYYGKADLAISVDVSTRAMLGSASLAFDKAGAVLEIDHHRVRAGFGDHSLIDADAAAVGEMVYLLLKSMKADITLDIAQNILTSIIVETSSFRLPNLSPMTFKISAELIEKGVDFYKLVDTVFWSYSKEAAQLAGICLARARFLENGQLAWSVVRRKDFERTGGKDEDVDPVADQIRAIKDVRMVLFFREKDKDHMRVSLRSKNSINVARLAEKYGGGGHCDVAGCLIPNKASVMRRMLREARAFLHCAAARNGNGGECKCEGE